MTKNSLNFIHFPSDFKCRFFSLICILGPRKIWKPPNTKKSQNKTTKMCVLEDEPASSCEYIFIFKNRLNSFKENTVFRSLCPVHCSKKTLFFKLHCGRIYMRMFVCVDTWWMHRGYYFLTLSPSTSFLSPVPLKHCLSWVSYYLCITPFLIPPAFPRMKESFQGDSLSSEFIRLFWSG